MLCTLLDTPLPFSYQVFPPSCTMSTAKDRISRIQGHLVSPRASAAPSSPGSITGSLTVVVVMMLVMMVLSMRGGKLTVCVFRVKTSCLSFTMYGVSWFTMMQGFGAGASTPKPPQAFVARTFDTPARLQSERAKASFPVREMTYFLDGSPQMTALKEEMMAQLAANPAFNDDEWNDLSRAQYRERTLKRVREAYKLLITDGSDVARRNARSGVKDTGR